MGFAQWLVLLVAVQRLGELALARRNTARLLARGGREVGARHYPLIVVLHAGWLIAIFLAVPADATPAWPLLALFVLLQVGRIWVIASIGEFWTTRIVTVPNAPLVRQGPYRWARHPNYLVVIGEIAVLPLTFGAWAIAVVFSLANAAVLTWRIRVENAALEPRRDTGISH